VVGFLGGRFGVKAKQFPAKGKAKKDFYRETGRRRSDGSVHGFFNSGLRETVKNSGASTNVWHIALPE
jgi:hypothetical protein